MQVELKTQNSKATRLRAGDKVLFNVDGAMTILRASKLRVNYLHFHESWAKSKTFFPPRSFRGSHEIIMQLISLSSGLGDHVIREHGSAFAYVLYKLKPQ